MQLQIVLYYTYDTIFNNIFKTKHYIGAYMARGSAPPPPQRKILGTRLDPDASFTQEFRYQFYCGIFEVLTTLTRSSSAEMWRHLAW
jgi:hypothetical protein